MDHMTPQEAVTSTYALMKAVGLEGWTVTLSRRLTATSGRCYHSQKRIELAVKVMAGVSREEVWDTCTHEVAHAMAGAKAGHGPVWKAMHRSLGGSGKTKTTEQPVNLRYHLVCQCDAIVSTSDRRPGRRLEGARHTGCGKKVHWRDTKTGKLVFFEDFIASIVDDSLLSDMRQSA